MDIKEERILLERRLKQLRILELLQELGCDVRGDIDIKKELVKAGYTKQAKAMEVLLSK